MSTWIEPPPRQKGMGCFAKGCLTFLAFIILLLVALSLGTYAGFRYLLTGTAPKSITEVAVSSAEAQSLQQRWDDFESARKNHQQARVEFSAQEINQLISANHDLRGKAFVSIENNVFHLLVSAPLGKLGFRGRYLNGEIALQAPPDGDPRGVEVKKIALSGVDVSERVLDFISGRHSLRSYIDQYSSDDDVTKVQIVGDKVILESRGGR
ncbi:MAG: hypothetical protein ABJB22_01830 [Verrucomicrobiota bacterium]